MNDPSEASVPTIASYEIWHTYDYPNYDGDAAWQFPSGWWYWWCIPGKRAGSEPVGPFLTRQAAERAVHTVLEQAESQRSPNR